MILTFLKFLLVAYFSLLLLMFFSQRQMLYFPPADPGPPAANGLPQAKVITVATTDGLALRSWYIPPGSSGHPVIVFFHGNAASLASFSVIATALAGQGYGVLITSYRGYSGNPGSPTEKGIYEDARANLRWLEEQELPFVLYGQSLGSGVAVRMATEFASRAVILEAPYTSIAATAQYHYPYLPAYWLVRDRFDSLSRIADIKAPLLVLHGERDSVIPIRFGRELFAAAREPKQAVWLPQAEHHDINSSGGFAAVQDFLEQQIRQ